MVLVSLMDIHVIISGAVLLVHLKIIPAWAATSNCPCSPAQGAEPQEFIGSNYYCESGYPSNTLEVFTSDPLWDGEQCEGTCCSGTKYRFLPKHLIGLRCVFVLMSPLAMKMS